MRDGAPVGLLDAAGNLQFTETTYPHPDPNAVAVYLAWDTQALYAVFDVADQRLVHLPDEEVPEVDILEKENTGIYLYADAEKLLFLNDSIDLHVTADTSVTTQTRPADYQFIVTVLEKVTVLRGSTMLQQIVPAWETPKAVDPKVVYEQAVRYDGTLNYNTDHDEGYVVELAIPWAAIGVREPYAGKPLRILAAVNDNEEAAVPTRTAAEPAPVYFAEDWCGVSDYGLPHTWRSVTLAETPTSSNAWIWLLGGLIALAAGLGWLFWKRRQSTTASTPPLAATTGAPPPSPEAVFLERARAVVLAHLDDNDFSVASFAEALHVSPRHLHRKISQATDQSPAVFIRTIRLEHAAHLLTTETSTVASIAFAVGFSDPSHFSKAFRQKYGLSPSAYRATQRQEAA